MGYGLEDILQDLKEFEDNVDYFLSCIGYKPTDISNDLSNLRMALIEANEESLTPSDSSGA